MSDDALSIVAKLMELSARTAPKAMGQDFIEIGILTGEQKNSLGREMLKVSEERKSPGFKRDGQNILDSPIVILIGLLEHPGLGINCSACGFESCRAMEAARTQGDFLGPNCAHRLADLGIAVGSAVKTAGLHNADNRVMERAGLAARRMGVIKSNIAYGIPLSASGKSIFFDRKPI
jgi:uncharacterized ferredoxin-like protein